MSDHAEHARAIDLDRALTNPALEFDNPKDVLTAVGLSTAQKIEILKRWELDARALQRATDESMGGGEEPRLDEVNEALAVLDPENKTPDRFGDAPTKI